MSLVGWAFPHSVVAVSNLHITRSARFSRGSVGGAPTGSIEHCHYEVEDRLQLRCARLVNVYFKYMGALDDAVVADGHECVSLSIGEETLDGGVRFAPLYAQLAKNSKVRKQLFLALGELSASRCFHGDENGTAVDGVPGAVSKRLVGVSRDPDALGRHMVYNLDRHVQLRKDTQGLSVRVVGTILLVVVINVVEPAREKDEVHRHASGHPGLVVVQRALEIRQVPNYTDTTLIGHPCVRGWEELLTKSFWNLVRFVPKGPSNRVCL